MQITEISNFEFQKWRKGLFLLTVLLSSLVFFGLVILQKNIASLWVFAGTAYCLAGYYMLEIIALIFSNQRKANFTAVVLVFLGKLAWWALAILAIFYVQAAAKLPIALGCAAFFLAIIGNLFWSIGRPAIE